MKSDSVSTSSPSIAPAPARRAAASDSGGRDHRIDGLRGLAILLVLYHHIFVSMGIPLSRLFPFDGLFGVGIFFVISGYLITTLLLNERAAVGRISLWRFYGRRSVRIFPAFYFFIVVMMVARSQGWVEFDQKGLLASIFYFRNVGSYSDSVLQHTWSLAVEEQFYLFWPFCLVFVPERFWKWVVVGGILAKPALKLVLSGGYATGAVALNSIGFDAIFWGVGLALWLHASPGWRVEAGRGRRLGFDLAAGAAVGLLWLLYFTAERFTGPATVLVQMLRNGLMVFILSYCVMRQAGWVSAALSWRPLVAVGLISYSLYLWQQPLLVGKIDSAVSLALRLGLLGVMACLSYFCIERTTHRFRRYFVK